DMFETRCIRGIRADRAQCQAHVDRSIGVITALVPHIGYANASRIAAQALNSGATVRELVIGEGLLSAAQLDLLLSPQTMLAPQRAA
ncbi:MAG: aspartate ammonia-lyase, partial [Denitromonas sp.]